MSSSISSIHWFRKGLRLHDNHSLLAALEKEDFGYYQLRPVYILDPNIKATRSIGANRWRFLLQSLENLDKSLREIGSRLYVLRGKPEDVFAEIFKKWNVKKLTFEVDIEPYAKARDETVCKLAEKSGIKVVYKVSHTIYDTDAVIKKNNGAAPLKLQRWIAVAESLPAPPRAMAAPGPLPAGARAPPDPGKYALPTLQELGVDPKTIEPCLYPGGETEALRRMEEHIAMKEYIRTFEKPNTLPNSLKPSTTVLSPYLRFGCLSPRLFYYKLKEVVAGHKHSKPPVSLIGQMYWREFYYTVGAATPAFDKMEGSPVCVQVPWERDPQLLDAWAHGRTGYPFIDAIMRQLRSEGWIHHLARHAVACFLTRGDLWQHWEDGQKVFEELLLDADWSLNAGNWLWLSASAFFSQFYRVYSPVAFGKKTDKTGEYVRKYVPEVRNLPSEYVYEPWNATKGMLERAGCVLGKDYPHRIVIHEEVYKKNIGRMSAAYKHTKELRAEAGSSQQKEAMDEEPPKKKTKKTKTIKDFFKK